MSSSWGLHLHVRFKNVYSVLFSCEVLFHDSSFDCAECRRRHSGLSVPSLEVVGVISLNYTRDSPLRQRVSFIILNPLPTRTQHKRSHLLSFTRYYSFLVKKTILSCQKADETFEIKKELVKRSARNIPSSTDL